jgi:hypothetical protein
VTFIVGAGGAHAWRRLRLALLTVACVAIVHEVSFRAQFGVGTAFDTAMANSGHGQWWSIFLGASLIVVAGLALTAVARHRSLSSELQRTGASQIDIAPARSRRREWLSLWVQLGAWVVALFLAQENIEHLITDGHLVGLEPLGGPLVWAVLTVATLLAAAGGAIVLWTEARLWAGICRARARHHRRIAIRPHPRWSATVALGLRSELLSRHLVGRAPPVLRA